MTDGIILLHGMCFPSFTMIRLANFLKKSGFKVLNINYPSTRYSLEDLSDAIHPNIRDFALTIDGHIHLVSFSMGGLLARCYLTKYPLSKLKHVVMIAPPNNGSEVADFLHSFKIYKWWFGPSGLQLITDQSKWAASLGKINYELGIIAGNKLFWLLPSYIHNQPNDGLVSVESTKLEEAQDHIILPYNHLTLLFNTQTMQQVLNFIKLGRFDHTVKSK